MTKMLRRLTGCLVLSACLLLPPFLLPPSAAADPVRLVVDGRGLDGELHLASGKAIHDGVMVLVHGTLAHNRMEIMQMLQETLGARGISTLAVTLSLGVSDRRGMYDCAVPHRSSNAQAAGEIAAWIGWAQQQGAAKIGLLGHSRGGAQVALYAAQAGDRLPAALTRIVLVAPGTFDMARAAADYHKRYGTDLAVPLQKAQALVAVGQGDTLLTRTDFLYCPQASVAAASFVDTYADDGRNDAPSQLAAIRRPVLLAIAGSDEIVADLPQRLATAAKPAQFHAMTVEGADHFFKDLFGEDLADAIAAFWKG
ncbi:alpha/beta hydrolase [Ferrovibrio xuzhouensis]|uniref:Alpha/beta hydrolase n=1 Tax=Ferrovibrio xuzhouensis TaxID=1576914 RepID=A0ABV7VNJ2_9PROT